MNSAQTSTAGPGGFALQLAADPAAVGPARGAFTSWLAEKGVGDEALAELPIVFSELVTNATEAASDHREVTARAQLDGDTVLIEVSNPVETPRAEVTRWDLDDALRGGGRGLVIVREFTDDLQVAATDGSVTVTCWRHSVSE